MRKLRISANLYWGEAHISIDEGPHWLFALDHVLDEIVTGAVHDILDRLRFPAGTRYAEGWGNPGQMWCAWACNGWGNYAVRKFATTSWKVPIEEAWQLSEGRPAQRQFLITQLRDALGNPPADYVMHSVDIRIPDIGFVLNAGQATLPGGRTFVPCEDCAGTGEQDEEVPCPSCVMVTLVRKDSANWSAGSTTVTPLESAAIMDHELRRYDDGTVARDSFSSGWVPQERRLAALLEGLTA